MPKLSLTKKYVTYPKYKDSGVEWLGNVPTDWNVQKVVTAFNFSNEKGFEDDYDALSVTYGGIKKQLDTAAKVADGSVRKRVRIGDIVINSRSDRKGAVGESKYDGVVSLVYNVLRPRNDNFVSKYYHYLFRSKDFSEEFYRWGRGIVDDLWTTRANEMKSIFLTIPPKDEQEKIARFLDEQTAHIDETIAKKQKLIELLKEKRTATINHAVTKGLDPKAELIESGIDWIGKIPKGWQVRPVKELFKISRGRVIAKTKIDMTKKYPVYSSQTKNDGVMGFIDTYDFDRSALTWTTDGANAGTVFYREGKFNCTNVCGVLTPKTDVELKYFVHSVQVSATPNKRLDTNGYKIMSNEMKNIFIVVPPELEQKKIAEFLSKMTKKIFEAEDVLRNSIVLLEEFKSSLISHAVTGKIKI